MDKYVLKMMSSGTVSSPSGSGASTPVALPPSFITPAGTPDLKSLEAPFKTTASSPDHQVVLDSLEISALPVSALLRQGTAKAHTLAEHSDGARALAAGVLEEKEYLRYLVVLWKMYRMLEIALNSIIPGTKGEAACGPMWTRSALLSRTKPLEEDIRFFTARVNSSTSTLSKALGNTITIPGVPFPVPKYLSELFLDAPSDIADYTTRLADLAERQPERLLAHAYVRYLGDLSGGQLVAAKIKRTYHLGEDEKDEPFPEGTKFYEFAEPGMDRIDAESHEGKAEMKKRADDLKNWFRETMDSSVGDDDDLKAALVDEAITAFQLSTRLFALLEPPPGFERKTPASIQVKTKKKPQVAQRKRALPTLKTLNNTLKFVMIILSIWAAYSGGKSEWELLGKMWRDAKEVVEHVKVFVEAQVAALQN